MTFSRSALRSLSFSLSLGPVYAALATPSPPSVPHGSCRLAEGLLDNAPPSPPQRAAALAGNLVPGRGFPHWTSARFGTRSAHCPPSLLSINPMSPNAVHSPGCLWRSLRTLPAPPAGAARDRPSVFAAFMTTARAAAHLAAAGTGSAPSTPASAAGSPAPRSTPQRRRAGCPGR